MRFKIPESFRIAGVTHEVRFDPDMALDGRSMGQAGYFRRKVTIASQLCAEEQRSTFVHEALHHIDNLFDTQLKESQLIRLATGVAELIQQLELDEAEELAGMIMERGREA